MSQIYNHPYEPYPIQVQFMDALTELLTKDYKIGLFESPTGTGKTLSLICSSMTWLRRKESEINSGLSNVLEYESDDDDDDDDDSEPDWVKESFKKIQMKTNNDKAEAYEQMLDVLSKSSKNVLNDQISNSKIIKKRKIEIEIEDDDQFVPGVYNSEDEDQGPTDRNSELNEEVKSMLRQFNQRHKLPDDTIVQDIKIIFASRTHSQLSQFSSQLKLPEFPSSLSVKQHLKYVPLGSRKQLCIHEKVSKIKDATLMNEACLDLQKSTEASKCCHFYPSPKDSTKQAKSIEFKDRVFTHIHDIEDLPELGKRLGTCPYYALRKGIPSAEVITLPYQILLQKSSRDALGLNLKDCVIMIDEAHNLIDTITSIFSVTVKLSEFIQCKDSLKTYYSKFSKKMNGGNRVNLLKLMKLINLVTEYGLSQQKQGIKPGKPIFLSEMFENTTGDLLNVHKLVKYLTVSKIGYKIQGYIDKLQREQDPFDNPTLRSSSSSPTLFKVIEFLKSIANPSSEGKFFFDFTGTSSQGLTLNYMLLDPSHMFKDIVEQSKSVILVGGTLEPVSDFTDYLFPYVSHDKILKFSCDHIIPRENLKVFPVSGFNGNKFEFTFDKRNDTKMVNSVGEFITELALRVPKGIVVFLPSYKYLEETIDTWKKSGVYQMLENVKRVHFERQSSNTNELLAGYTNDINSSINGAILFSVVGGRLSEGINFNDDLARSVIIIGLPYPNLFSGEIINKRKYIESTTLKRTKGDQKAANEAMRQFYENICMKAVNQSIGRSIRHVHDYSTIYLLDARYSAKGGVQNKLSKWIRNRIEDYDDLNGKQEKIFVETSNFFQEKMTQQING